jgi:NADPH:quinone reductase
MRAIGVREFGDPDVLHLLDLPDPETGPGELRIRVHAAAVNPTDTGLRSGGRAQLLKDVPPPYVPGMDAAGVLEEIGEGVSTDLQVGDHVMVIVVPHAAHGAYSERIVVPADSVARVPKAATDAEASTLPMNGLTTRQALDLLGLGPGETLAVTGAAGAVGGYAVELGKADGLRVIADASEADEQLVKDLGADIVVRRGDAFAERVRQAIPDGADGLIDGALLNELVTWARLQGQGRARRHFSSGIRPQLRPRAGQARSFASTGGSRSGDAQSGSHLPGRGSRHGSPHPRGRWYTGSAGP